MARSCWLGAAVLGIVGGLALALLFLLNTPGAEPPEQHGRHDGSLRGEEAATAQGPSTMPVLGGAPHAGSGTGRATDAPEGERAGTLFLGKVLNAGGQPASGAAVQAVASDGVVASVAADTEGAFRFRIFVAEELGRQRGLLRARGTDGAVGQALIHFATPSGPGAVSARASVGTTRDLGILRLGPPHAFEVRVTSRCPTGIPATLWLLSPVFRVEAPWVTTMTDAQGAASFEGVPAGLWALVASAPGCGRVRTLVQLPRESTEPVMMELPEAHVLTARVQDAQDASPIAGATVRVTEQLRLPRFSSQSALVSAPSSYVTDAQGVVRIDALGGEETLYLSTEAQGYPRGSEHGRGRGRGPGEARVEPGQTDVLIKLHKPMVVRWPIKDEGIGIPADGTEVAIEPWTNTGRLTVPPRGVIEGQEVVVEGWGPDGASGYAVIAGRGIARLRAGRGVTKGYPTAFHPLRRIDLVVRLSDGSPAEGWFLNVRDQGNNAVKPDVKTDAAGRCTMEGLYGGPGSLVDVSVSDGRGWGGFTMPLGSVNLYEGDGRFEAEIPAERTIRIRLTVQGRTVPETFSGHATVNHQPIAAAEPGEAFHGPGCFVARWRPISADAAAHVSAKAAGYLAETKVISLTDTPDAAEVVIDLRPAGALRVKVTEPADKRYRIAIDQWNPELETWGTPGLPQGFSSGRRQRADANGFLEFLKLEPGRYRARETLSGLTSEGIEVLAGGDPARILFDASTTGWVKGRVVLPEGFPFHGTTVGDVDAKVDEARVLMPGTAHLPGSRVNAKDGTFWIRVPGNRPVTLRLFHAILQPHPTQGQVTVMRPQEDVVLQAVRGATATLHFSTPAPVDMNRGQARPISVRLYKGPPQGPGIQLSGVLDATHQRVEFGGHPPGIYTLWIDVPGCAPVVLSDVTLGTEDRDLGQVDLSPGATFEIRVTTKEGQSPPRYAVWLQKLDEPTYTRHTDSAGETITVAGIGAGRFRVGATAYNGASPGIQEEIEFDGHTSVVRTIDAR
jgi:hypothetical protein